MEALRVEIVDEMLAVLRRDVVRQFLLLGDEVVQDRAIPSGRTRELSAASREAAAAANSPRGSRAGSIMSGMSPGFLRKGSSFSKK